MVQPVERRRPLLITVIAQYVLVHTKSRHFSAMKIRRQSMQSGWFVLPDSDPCILLGVPQKPVVHQACQSKPTSPRNKTLIKLVLTYHHKELLTPCAQKIDQTSIVICERIDQYRHVSQRFATDWANVVTTSVCLRQWTREHNYISFTTLIVLDL